jgi:putative membrane protein
MTALALLAACGGEPKARYAAQGDTGDTPALTDAGIVTMVEHVNLSEVGAAKAAFPKLQNAEVRGFAERMIREHAAMNASLDRLPVKGDTARFPPPQFATLQAVAQSQLAQLNLMLAGPAFDRNYMALQVLQHSQALDSLRQWYRAARNPELRGAIEAALPRVRAHQQSAEALVARLGGGLDPGVVAPPPPDTSWARRAPPAPSAPDTGRS